MFNCAIPFNPMSGATFKISERADAFFGMKRFGVGPNGGASVLSVLWPPFRRTRDRQERVSASLPPRHRIYAIGDIHGRADLYDSLAESIRQDAISRRCESVLTVFLGDYIDRGPDSAAVLERLASKAFPTPFIALRGNHEAILLEFLEDESVLDRWRSFGGLETLASYNVDVTEVMRGRGFKAAQESLRRNLPTSHRDFLEETRLSYTMGDYFFCHAGVRPGTALEQQTPRDLLWIREEFLSSSQRFSKRIVHGHNPAPGAEFLPNRINVDTGAYATNVLTAVILEGNSARIVATGDGTALDRASHSPWPH